ncbi:hypothetical protein Lal_00042949 [Lupinus albus]|nr:hypothetical protein Lal_00042949 [Lupinus albus]
MNSVSLSQSKLLPYSIFISRIVDYLHIDVSDTIIVEYTDKDHLVGESLIHKIGIYKYGTTWQYQEDYSTIGLDLSDDDNQGGMGDQHATTQGEPSGTTCQEEHFGKLSLFVMVLMRTTCATCANKSLMIINKSTCLSLLIEIVVTLGISRCRIAEETECIFIVFRLRDKERTEVLGWGYAERKVFFVGRKGVKP